MSSFFLQILELTRVKLAVDDHNGAVERTALDKSGVMQHLHFGQETECARSGELRDEFLFEIEEPRVLASQRGVLIVHHHGHAEIVERQRDDVHFFFGIRILYRPVDDQVVLRRGLFRNARLLQGLNIGHRAPVADRRLHSVDFDDKIVDLQTRYGREHMLHRVNLDIAVTQRRTARHVDNVVDNGWNFRIPPEVCANKTNAVVLRCRPECQSCCRACVKAGSGERSIFFDCPLLYQHVFSGLLYLDISFEIMENAPKTKTWLSVSSGNPPCPPLFGILHKLTIR